MYVEVDAKSELRCPAQSPPHLIKSMSWYLIPRNWLSKNGTRIYPKLVGAWSSEGGRLQAASGYDVNNVTGSLVIPKVTRDKLNTANSFDCRFFYFDKVLPEKIIRVTLVGIGKYVQDHITDYQVNI